MKLYPYQENAVRDVLAHMRAAPESSGCLVLPTGAGKSVVLADLSTRFANAGKRVLMLTHVKELIAQNAKRIREYSGRRVGIYSSGLGKRDTKSEILFAGIQSVATRARELGPFDVIVIDEAHLIAASATGRYRSFLDDSRTLSPSVRILGLTATPWRLGHGRITDGETRLFDTLIEPEGCSVWELVQDGYLSPLRSKPTGVKLLELVEGCAKRGGDFVESELAKVVDQAHPNSMIAREIVARGEDRKHWLVFCVSVAHAQHMAAELNSLGAPCGVVHGAMGSLERSDALSRFQCGEYRALANVNVLTTGYDFPAIDMLALCRPTLSPVLYAQTCGRGMRRAEGKDDCLVLDFAGLVATHGPITDVQPPLSKSTVKPGAAPIRLCPKCDEQLSISAKVCTCCGHEFPVIVPEKPQETPVLYVSEIMDRGEERVCTGWHWDIWTSRASGKKSIVCKYRTDGGPVQVWFSLFDKGRAGEISKHQIAALADRSGAGKHIVALGTEQILRRMNAVPHPNRIRVRADGEFFRVTGQKWDEEDVRRARESKGAGEARGPVDPDSFAGAFAEIEAASEGRADSLSVAQ